jgi:hypothetical protein
LNNPNLRTEECGDRLLNTMSFRWIDRRDHLRHQTNGHPLSA